MAEGSIPIGLAAGAADQVRAMAAELDPERPTWVSVAAGGWRASVGGEQASLIRLAVALEEVEAAARAESLRCTVPGLPW